MVFTSKTWVDVPDEQNPPVGAVPTSAAEFNRLEQGIVDAHAHLAETLLAHGGVLIYVGESTAPPANPPTGLLWMQTDGLKRDLRNTGTPALPVWEDVTRDKLVASDLVTDYVVSGLLPAVPSPKSLSASVPAGSAYVIGRRVVKAAETLGFTANSDTYVDLDRDGVYRLSPVARGAAAPALYANSIRLFMAATDASVAQVERVTVATVLNSTVYTVRINGVDVTYTSDATATAAEISAGLVAAINASVDPNVTPVTAADEVGAFTVTADVAGTAFTITVDANLTVANVTPNNVAGIISVADLRTTNPTVRGSSAGGGHTIQDEGVSLAARTNLNFVGAGVTVTDDSANNQTDVTIPGGGSTTPEAWHEVGAAGEPTFQNGWLNYDGGTTFDTAGFYKDPQGRVHLKGLVKGGTVAAGATGTVFTLPAGYRPAKYNIYLIYTYATSLTIGRLNVRATGEVQIEIGGNDHASLEGISFRAV